MQYILPSDQQLHKKFLKSQIIQTSEQKKTPNIFKWKTASIIMGSISCILLLIICIAFYNLQTQQQFQTNLTFLSSIVLKTQILTNKQQLIYLNKNFQKIYGQTKFQKSILLDQQLTHLSQINLREIFYEENERLLFLFQIESDDQIQTKFAIFMNSPFPVPKIKQFNYSTTYYSFQINQHRKSSLLSLTSQQTLTLTPSSLQIKSPLQCKTYHFQTNHDQGISFKLLNNLIQFSLEDVQMKINVQNQYKDNYKCFTPEFSNEEEFKIKVENIVGKKSNEKGLRFKKAEVYHLE